MATLAISTMWGAQGRYANLGDYMPTREQLAQLLARPDLVVSSVHNICPRPTDETGARIPDPSLVATDENERRAAVALTKATMDLALRVGTDAVVVHAGWLIVSPDEEAWLDKLYREGYGGNPNYLLVQGSIRAKRAIAAAPAMAQLHRSLADLVPYAEATGVRLGLETRQDYRDMPILEEARATVGNTRLLSASRVARYAGASFGRNASPRLLGAARSPDSRTRHGRLPHRGILPARGHGAIVRVRLQCRDRGPPRRT